MKLSKFTPIIITFIIFSICILSGLFWYFQIKPKNNDYINNAQSSNAANKQNEIIQDAENSWSTDVNNKYISGEWSKEDYILNNLAYIIENKGKNLAPEKSVDNIEQTFLMSNIYLQSGKDQAVKNKIKDFHKIIYHYNESLNKERSSKNILSFFDTIKVNAETIGGFEYAPFRAADLTNFVFTRPEHRIEPEFVELLKTAVTESYTKYQELGYELKPASVVVYLDEYRLTRGTAEASASVVENQCVINTWEVCIMNLELWEVVMIKTN